MSSTLIRKRLHDFIDQADERILKLLYGMLSADKNADDFALTDNDKKILDERLEDHDAAPGEGSTWKEVKARTTKK